MKYLIVICFLFPISLFAQMETVPFDHVMSNNEIIDLLHVGYSKELKVIQDKYYQGEEQQALKELADYFKERFSERYFFDWKNFSSRFAEYNKMYPGREQFHYHEAIKHLELYPAYSQWKLPFKNLKGETVTAYPYRHLTRQHKAMSIALLYFYKDDKKYLDYIPEQAKSLDEAFNNDQCETIKDGNGAYEAYRAGNRIFNWLQVHQILLASTEYSTAQQLEMIRAFLHTGAKLFHHNQKYREGNHQTRGMSGLAMLAFLFPEIHGTDQWKSLSLSILEEHLEKEIYPDGFQFERSLHYHLGDIENYFYPYHLAKLNNIELDPIWEARIKGLFDVLLKLAMPNKKAPILQDDTDSPWSEYNKIDDYMALGASLFGDPEYVYFASSKVSPDYYWYLKQDQLSRLKMVKKKEPEIGSCVLPETGYYVMRNGWDKDDMYMVISAGITPEKLAHQHGDMLGVEAYAYGNMILPNYQVRYYLKDLPEFKNSWVKNVVLVDSIPQGSHWKENKGGTGFGYFETLPIPRVIAWKNTPIFDLFIGKLNDNVPSGIQTYRTVIFVKDGFWIVRDKLIANKEEHMTQQVWQGHYDVEKARRHIRSVFPNGAGLEIIELGEPADEIFKASAHGKGRSIFQKTFSGETSWATLLFPFGSFEKRLTSDDYGKFKAGDWTVVSSKNCPASLKTDASQIIYKNENYLLIDVSTVDVAGEKISFPNGRTDLWIKFDHSKIEITNCGMHTVELNKASVKPGKDYVLELAPN